MSEIHSWLMDIERRLQGLKDNGIPLLDPAPNIDQILLLAQDIRTIDGNHDKGACEIAEELIGMGWHK